MSMTQLLKPVSKQTIIVTFSGNRRNLSLLTVYRDKLNVRSLGTEVVLLWTEVFNQLKNLID